MSRYSTRQAIDQELKTTITTTIPTTILETSLNSLETDLAGKSEDLKFLTNKQERLQKRQKALQTTSSEQRKDIDTGERITLEQEKVVVNVQRNFDNKFASLLSKVSKDVKRVIPALKQVVGNAIEQVEDVVNKNELKLKKERNETQKKLGKYEHAAMEVARELEQAQVHTNEARRQVDTSQKDIMDRGKEWLTQKLQELAPTSDWQASSPNDFIQHYQDRWSGVQPRTAPRLGSMDLRDHEYVKKSLTVLARLDDRSNENPSKETFWKLYGTVIDNTISSWNNPPAQGAGDQLVGALKMLNKANTLASGFLDWQYGTQ